MKLIKALICLFVVLNIGLSAFAQFPAAEDTLILVPTSPSACVAAFTATLTPAEIAELYAGGFTPTPPNNALLPNTFIYFQLLGAALSKDLTDLLARLRDRLIDPETTEDEANLINEIIDLIEGLLAGGIFTDINNTLAQLTEVGIQEGLLKRTLNAIQENIGKIVTTLGEILNDLLGIQDGETLIPNGLLPTTLPILKYILRFVLADLVCLLFGGLPYLIGSLLG